MSLGIDNLKNLLKVGLTTGQDIANDLKDGKISFLESFGLVQDAFAGISVVKTWKDVEAELADLTPAEQLELQDYAMANFNIPNAKVKTFIQHALTNVISLVALVDEFKHIKDPVFTP